MQMMVSCNNKLTEYDSLVFQFGVVASKDDVDKAGQARLKAAAVQVTKEALTLARFCTLNLATLATTSLEKAVTTVMNCKSERDFANDSCPELKFSSRQLMSEFNTLNELLLVKLLQWRSRMKRTDESAMPSLTMTKRRTRHRQ